MAFIETTTVPIWVPENVLLSELRRAADYGQSNSVGECYKLLSHLVTYVEVEGRESKLAEEYLLAQWDRLPLSVRTAYTVHMEPYISASGSSVSNAGWLLAARWKRVLLGSASITLGPAPIKEVLPIQAKVPTPELILEALSLATRVHLRVTNLRALRDASWLAHAVLRRCEALQISIFSEGRADPTDVSTSSPLGSIILQMLEEPSRLRVLKIMLGGHGWGDPVSQLSAELTNMAGVPGGGVLFAWEGPSGAAWLEVDGPHSALVEDLRAACGAFMPRCTHVTISTGGIPAPSAPMREGYRLEVSPPLRLSPDEQDVLQRLEDTTRNITRPYAHLQYLATNSSYRKKLEEAGKDVTQVLLDALLAPGVDREAAWDEIGINMRKRDMVALLKALGVKGYSKWTLAELRGQLRNAYLGL